MGIMCIHCTSFFKSFCEFEIFQNKIWEKIIPKYEHSKKLTHTKKDI